MKTHYTLNLVVEHRRNHKNVDRAVQAAVEHSTAREALDAALSPAEVVTFSVEQRGSGSDILKGYINTALTSLSSDDMDSPDAWENIVHDLGKALGLAQDKLAGLKLAGNL